MLWEKEILEKITMVDANKPKPRAYLQGCYEGENKKKADLWSFCDQNHTVQESSANHQGTVWTGGLDQGRSPGAEGEALWEVSLSSSSHVLVASAKEVAKKSTAFEKKATSHPAFGKKGNKPPSLWKKRPQAIQPLGKKATSHPAFGKKGNKPPSLWKKRQQATQPLEKRQQATQPLEKKALIQATACFSGLGMVEMEKS